MKNLFLFFLFSSVTIAISCKKPAGEKASVQEEATVSESSGKILAVDLASSVINWEGAKPTATHTGTIKLSGGSVSLEGRTITGGSFTIDMSTLQNTDLSGGMKDRLENHLKGISEGREDDFFNITRFPTSKFEITRVTKLSGDESATHLIYGNLTMRDVTKEIGFKALIGIGRSRIEVTTPPFTIDRTLWGINYGSRTVFDNLGDNFVHDEIGLSISLKAGEAVL